VSSSSTTDTIIAPATPVGRSALAILRIDGPRSATILTELAGVYPEERLATLVYLRQSGEVIDECVAIRYAAPRSFTGNDMVELTLHGNPVLVERVLRATVSLGARIAEPGEFSERAVLNGKIDLLQAESIADLIAARTPLQAKLSLNNLDGVLSRTASAIRESLLSVISRLEAALDFSDEGYEFIGRDEATRSIETAISSCATLAETYRRGRATIHGLSAVILGRPNAGKSTLLNRLVGSDRAIVTPTPGTTRDIVRETIDIGGLPVTLADTAGLREAIDSVEEIGVERARQAATAADLIVYLVDASVGMTAADSEELARLGRADVMKVFTKIDLAVAPPGETGISVATDAGVSEFLAMLDAIVRERFAAPEEAPTIVNERQQQAVAECESALREAVASLRAGLDEQVVLVDLYRAANALGLLTGAITRDEIFESIFSKFCIGK
jgi:tRNA modification GTPase